ncbi:MAG: glycosyltransferase [Bacillota bacterium]|nr:glycosyltransferase [Bacillota bacterium]
MKLCSILCLAWNMLPYTQECVESLFRYTCYPFELIIVDNGSTDHVTGEYLKNLEPDTPYLRRYKVTINPENLGTTKGGNQLLREAAGDYLAIISNDMIFVENWLEDIIGYMEENPDISSVSPAWLSGDLDTFSERAEHYKQLHGIAQPGYMGGMFVMTRECFNKVGYFDEQFEKAGWEDRDYELRLLLNGCKPVILHKVVLYHYGMVTRKHFDGKYEAENACKFAKKYGLL